MDSKGRLFSRRNPPSFWPPEKLAERAQHLSPQTRVSEMQLLISSRRVKGWWQPPWPGTFSWRERLFRPALRAGPPHPLLEAKLWVAPSCTQGHHGGGGRETPGSSRAQRPAQLCAPCDARVWQLFAMSPDSGGRAEDTSPPSFPKHHQVCLGSLVSGPGWEPLLLKRPPARAAGSSRGHSFRVINMVTEFAQGQSWE